MLPLLPVKRQHAVQDDDAEDLAEDDDDVPAPPCRSKRISLKS
jgi:hypothetical protein